MNQSVVADASPSVRPSLTAKHRDADNRFRVLVLACAATTLLLLGAMAIFLVARSWPAIRHYGFASFYGSTRWAPSEASRGSDINPYGILQFIFGTAISALLALLMAVPIAVGIAVVLNERMPSRLRKILTSATELLAMIPSVVYGFWGIFALAPALKPVAGALSATIGQVPVLGVPFRGSFYGFSILTASVVLALMVLPIVAALSREIIATVPRDQREAAYAIGATRWEVLRAVVLPYARPGLTGAAFLGLGRALGETIAVTMVIGNQVLNLNTSLLGQGSTLASVIANEFTEANRAFHLSALFFVGLTLMLITLVVNALARTLIVGRTGPRR